MSIRDLVFPVIARPEFQISAVVVAP